MTNNDILRRLRYTFSLADTKVQSIFASTDTKVALTAISAWLKKEEDEGFIEMSDKDLALFLNGFINEKRGKKEGKQPAPETRLNFNLVLTKLKIALNLQAEDIIALMASVDFRVTKPELSAFTRKPDHKNYRVCKGQFMRNFLKGLQQKYRPEKAEKAQKSQKSFRPQTPREPVDRTARPNASKRYVNPNATKTEKPKSSKNTLKLKPEQIWKDHD